MLSFFLALLVLLGIVIAAADFLYWYEAGNSSDQDVPSLPFTLRNVLLLWALTARGLLLVVLAHPLALALRFWPRPPATDTPGFEAPPLLLLHGLYHDNSAWVLLRRHLRRVGFARIHMLRYPSARMTLEELPGRLENAVRELEQRYPGEKPLLLGHSLGGLIIRAWLAEKGNQERAAGALTLGAPHSGSKVAALAIGNLGKSLVPGNPFFTRLREQEEAATIPCVALVSPGDNMVLPPRNLAPVTRNWELRLTPMESHIGMLFSPAVHRMIAWELHRMTLPAAKDKAYGHARP